MTPLQKAAANNKIEMIKILLDAGGNVDYTDSVSFLIDSYDLCCHHSISLWAITFAAIALFFQLVPVALSIVA